MTNLIPAPNDDAAWMQDKQYIEYAAELESLGYESGAVFVSPANNVKLQAFYNTPFTAVIYFEPELGIRADVNFILADDREFTFSTCPAWDKADIRPSKLLSFFDESNTSILDLQMHAIDAFEKAEMEFLAVNANNLHEIMEDSFCRDALWREQKIDTPSARSELDEFDNKAVPNVDDEGDLGHEEKIATIDEIQSMAAEILATHTGETTTVYLFDKKAIEPTASHINRTAGKAIGVSDEAWPKHNGKRMHHVITIDLNTMPKLSQNPAFEFAFNLPLDTVAVALFVNDLMHNNSCKPFSDEVKVLPLTQNDLAQGENSWLPEHDDFAIEACAFEAVEVEVPVAIFDELIYQREDDDLIFRLYEEVASYSFAGGKPFWIQGNAHEADVLFQFDNSLVDMNLGDGGCMYVFEDTAFWQCY